VYSLQEIAVEKLVALSDRARNEPRDLYDLHFLISQADVRLSVLRTELEAKLAFRGRSGEGLDTAVANKEARLRRLWSARLAHQMNNLPPFDAAFRAVQRALRDIGFPSA